MKTQTLTCREGNHEWTRPSQRGKPPLYCPEHKPEQTTSSPRNNSGDTSETIKLTCSNCNKEWERPRQRGRVPSRCPECVEQARLDAPVRPPKPRTATENGNGGETLTKPKDNNSIIIGAAILEKTKQTYPDCKCDELGLREGMTLYELNKMAGGCCDSRVKPARGWVCERLVAVRNFYYKGT